MDGRSRGRWLAAAGYALGLLLVVAGLIARGPALFLLGLVLLAVVVVTGNA